MNSLPTIGHRSRRVTDSGEVPLSATDDGTELLRYLRTVRRFRWQIGCFTFLVMLATGIVTLAMTPIYRSTATVLVDSRQPKALSIEGDKDNAIQQPAHYQTQVELLQSREVADRTIRTLKLWEQPQFNPGSQRLSWVRHALSWFGREVSVVPATQDLLVDASYELFKKNLSIGLVGLSQIIDVNFDSPDRRLAAIVANEVARQYIESDHSARVAAANQVSGYLQVRLSSLREQLLQSERNLQDFRDKNGIVSLAGSPQTVAGQQVGTTSEQLVAARTRRAELQSAYEQVRLAHTGELGNIPAVARSVGVIETQRQVIDVQRRLAELSQTLGPNHTRVQEANSDLTQSRIALLQAQQSAAAGIKREFEAARDTENTMSKAFGGAQRDVQQLNRDEFRLGALERDVATNRQLYETFVNRSKEITLAGDVQPPVGRIADRAVPARTPIRPAKAQIVLISGFFAMVLGSLAAVMKDQFDTSIRSADEAEQRLGMPVLTVLPYVAKSDSLAREAVDAPFSAHSEAVRTARTGLMLAGIDTSHKIVLITSALPGEGKTTFACNLAFTHAQTERTLLIDADMRRSMATHYLGISPSALGLTNLLIGTATPNEAVHRVGNTSLQLMPVGDVLPPNPLDLLLSQRFQTAIKALSQHFDCIIIDSPPVELVSDSLALAPIATTTLMVVRAMSTPATVVRRAVARLRRSGSLSILAVVNSLEVSGVEKGRLDLQYNSYFSESIRPQLEEKG